MDDSLMMIRLAAHSYLLRAGDVASCAYLIEQGSMEVVLEDDGREQVIAVLGPGEIVGEMALIDQAPRSASVRTLEDCLVLPITADTISKRLMNADPVLQLVLGTVLDRFRGMLRNARSGDLEPDDRKLLRSHISIAAQAELRLIEDLEDALENQITVFYQPVVRLATGTLTGFEALARWVHPTRGLVLPANFVPQAEASGLSSRLAQTCIRQVVNDIDRLNEAAAGRPGHVEPLRIALNISGQDLIAPDFVSALASAVTGRQQSTGSITLELTETALVQSSSEAVEKLQEARRLGFKIDVDDFGTGYSSLNYIRTLPIDGLKIDKAFVQSPTDCATTESILLSMLRMAETLKLSVVAEGIEAPEQRDLLRLLGCTFGQGYLFGRPLPLEQTLDLVRGWRSSAGEPIICATAA